MLLFSSRIISSVIFGLQILYSKLTIRINRLTQARYHANFRNTTRNNITPQSCKFNT